MKGGRRKWKWQVVLLYVRYKHKSSNKNCPI
uniref:Uncharacterized protein n=1 Tax=Rhizophora mucronata TaxID=61149 RepID=A0A2P2PXR8_RHIMU